MPPIEGRLSAILDVWVSQNGREIRLNLAMKGKEPFVFIARSISLRPFSRPPLRIASFLPPTKSGNR